MLALAVKPRVEPAATSRVDADLVEAPTLQRMLRELTSVTGPLL